MTYRSNDPDDLEDILKRSRWARFRAVVTNGVQAFTARVSDLHAICDLAAKYDALVVVDDALGIGVLGDRGRGASELYGVVERVGVVTGSFSKAPGDAGGGHAAGQREIIDWLRQKSPPTCSRPRCPPRWQAPPWPRSRSRRTGRPRCPACAAAE